MFDDEFIESLPEDPIQAARAMCKHFTAFDEELRQAADYRSCGDQEYRSYLEALAAFESFSDAHGMGWDTPSLSMDRREDMQQIRAFVYPLVDALDKKSDLLLWQTTQQQFRNKFGVGFSYQFSDGDLSRIQHLLNELRDLVANSQVFGDQHKQRILNKLEDLQGELHKKMTCLDRFWGLFSETGVALGKFGNDAKPFVDRITEMAQIAWRTQARAEELPSATPLPLLSDSKAQQAS